MSFSLYLNHNSFCELKQKNFLSLNVSLDMFFILLAALIIGCAFALFFKRNRIGWALSATAFVYIFAVGSGALPLILLKQLQVYNRASEIIWRKNICKR